MEMTSRGGSFQISKLVSALKNEHGSLFHTLQMKEQGLLPSDHECDVKF
jgi:hypothetical protein